MNWSALWPVKSTDNIDSEKRFDALQRGRSFVNRPWDSFIRSPQVMRVAMEYADDHVNIAGVQIQ